MATGRQCPDDGFGIPASGGSELLPPRVADPAGGPPWACESFTPPAATSAPSKGAVLHIDIPSILFNACTRSVKISIWYTRSIEDNIAPTGLGEVTVHIPGGDHRRPLLHHRR